MKKRSRNKNFLLLVSICSIYIVYILISQQVQMYKFNKQIRINNEKIIQQEKETQSLLKAKETYKSDDFIEKIARERLGYVKAGEKVYIDKIQ